MTIEVPGELRDRFRIGDRVHDGRCGSLYRAEDITSGRAGVLRIVPGQALGGNSERQRLKRELAKQATLAHPGLALPMASGETGTVLWSFREWVEGTSLADRVADAPLGIDEVLAAGVTAALDELHRAGLLHRDLRPGRVILRPSGETVLLDAGIVAVLEAPGVYDAAGSPAYISPEQLSGDLVSFRSDLYALGCTLYELLTGAPPFGRVTGEATDDALVAVLEAHASETPTWPATVPETLVPLFEQLLVKDPRSRPFSAQQVRRSLDPHLPEALRSEADGKSTLPGMPVMSPGQKPPPPPSGEQVLSASKPPPPPGAAGSRPPAPPGMARPSAPPAPPGMARPSAPPAPPGMAKRPSDAAPEGTQQVSLDQIVEERAARQEAREIASSPDQALSDASIHVQDDAQHDAETMEATNADATVVAEAPQAPVADAPVADAEGTQQVSLDQILEAHEAVRGGAHQEAPATADPGLADVDEDIATSPGTQPSPATESPAAQSPAAQQRATESPATKSPVAPSSAAETAPAHQPSAVSSPAPADHPVAPAVAGDEGLDYDDLDTPARGAEPDAYPTSQPAPAPEPAGERVSRPTLRVTDATPPNRSDESTAPVALQASHSNRNGLFVLAAGGLFFLGALVIGGAIYLRGDPRQMANAVPTAPQPAGASAPTPAAPTPAAAPPAPPTTSAPTEALADESEGSDGAGDGAEAPGDDAETSLDSDARDDAAETSVARTEGATADESEDADDAEATPRRARSASAARPARRAAPRPASGGSSFDQTREAAREAFAGGRLQEAATLYERATSLNPRHAGSFAGLGAARLRMGDAGGAVAAYQRAIQLSPSNSGFFTSLGHAYVRAGNRAAAQQAYQRALALNPNNTAARNAMNAL